MKRSISEVSKDTQDLQIQLLTPKGKAPTRSTSEAAGYDLYSSEDIKVPPRTRILVSTDIAIQVPTGTYGRIAPHQQQRNVRPVRPDARALGRLKLQNRVL